MIFDQKPKFCVKCGDRLHDTYITTYDPQTGKKIKTVVSERMYCGVYCFAHYYINAEGKWATYD